MTSNTIGGKKSKQLDDIIEKGPKLARAISHMEIIGEERDSNDEEMGQQPLKQQLPPNRIASKSLVLNKRDGPNKRNLISVAAQSR